MSDETPFFSPTHKAARRRRTPNERLFECVRAADQAAIWFDSATQGAAGWKVHVFERAEWCEARGGFRTRDLAVEWAEAGADRARARGINTMIKGCENRTSSPPAGMRHWAAARGTRLHVC